MSEPRVIEAHDEDPAWIYAIVGFVIGLSAWIGLVGYAFYLLGKKVRP